MNKPLFSVVLIAKNEGKVISRLFQSLEEFKSRGGETCLVDTGSADNTVELAKKWGCKVKEVGSKFVHTINEQEAKDINKRFIVDNEDPLLSTGDKYFDFASARNESVDMSSNDWVCTVDADEILTKIDIDKINEIIKSDPNIAHFEYNFVFSHMPDGSELIKFVQSKFYNKKKMNWVGIIHEMVTPLPGGGGASYMLGEEIFKLEHWQNPETNRGGYLKGLAVDCFQHQEKDRNSHYFSREMFWNGRPFSSAKEFIRHINMNAWPAERAESMLFLCDICGAMGGMRAEEDAKNPEKKFKNTGITDPYIINSSLSSEELLERQLFWAHKALDTDPTRREPLIKLAQIYSRRGEWTPANLYATTSLEIPWSGFYGSNKRFYENEPHEILYRAKGWLGDIEGAKKHLLQCLEYQRENPMYLRDTQYYFDYAANNIPGWMSFEEQLFLFETAKKMDSVIECGSWKGKSTYAICKSGCKNVTAIDTWMGSEFEPEAHAEAKSGTVFEEFKNNLKDFPDLKIIKADINEAVKEVPDKSVDMIFIDAGHTYEEVLNDIRKWKNKARILLCGHDYCAGWPGVEQAVCEELGGPDSVHGTIWTKWLYNPLVSICIPNLGRPEKLKRLLDNLKTSTGYDNFEVIVETDQMPPNNLGAPTMLKKCVDRAKGDLICFLGNDCIPEQNFLREAVWEMIRKFPEGDGMIGLNDGYWDGSKGQVATHWMASKKLLPYLGGVFFDTDFYHTGVDNILQARCEKTGKYAWCEKAKIFHDHPMMSGKKEDMDSLYEQAYNGPRHDHDNALYEKKMKEYGLEDRTW